MAIEFSIEGRKNDKPPLAIIYGGSGTGKTSLADSAPNSVFLQTEDGAGELELRTLQSGIFTTLEGFMDALRYIYVNSDKLGTLVIDSLDHLEPLVWDFTCRKNGWDSIQTPGYGNGYVEADYEWRKIIKSLLKIRDDKNIAIICIAHDKIKPVNDPDTAPYDAHELKMHRGAVGLWKENADLIGLLKNRVVVDQKTGKGKGGTSPTLFVRPTAAFTAKTRYKTMPSSFSITLEEGWNDVMKYIPFYQNAA